MTTVDSKSNEWDICPPGLLQETGRVRNPKSRSVVAMLLILVASGAGFGAYHIASPNMQPAVQDFRPGGLSCAETRGNLLAFIQGEISDCRFHGCVSRHLTDCKDCKNVYCALKCSQRRRQKVIRPIVGTHQP